MPEDSDTKPIARRRGEAETPPRPQKRSDDDDAITVRNGTISIRTGTIITIIGGILGAGGGTGVMSYIGTPSAAVVARMDAQDARLAVVEKQLAEQERLMGVSSDLTRIIYKVILRSHPDAAISLEDLHFDPN